MGIFVLENRNGALQNNDAVVEMLVDEVNGAAGPLDSVVKGLFLCVESREGRKQRGMDVQDAIGKGGDELWREQTHVAGEDDQVDTVLMQTGGHVRVVVGAGTAFGYEQFMGQAQFLSRSQTGGVSDIGDDDGDLDAGEFAGADGFGDGEEVGAATGEKNAEPESWPDGRTRALRAWLMRG